MAWEIVDRFPIWGETGEFPIDGFFYEGGDQVNEKHLDALWNGLKELENDTRSALEEIDSDADGVVDEADYANDADASTYKGEDIDSDGDGTVNDADQYSGLSPTDGTDGYILQTDGENPLWVEKPKLITLEDGTEVVTKTDNINFINGMSVTETQSGTASVDANEAVIAHNFVMGGL